jgi:Tfp pilus assembly PilM family ATPase
VDVGTHTVKLAQVVRDGASVRLSGAAVIQRRMTWAGDDKLAFEQPIASSAEIRAALECGGFSGRNAVAALPMNVCQLRGLNLPPGSDQERRTMAGDELAEEWAERKVPMEFDFWELDAGTDKGADSFNVNILAASRPWISQLWRDCRKSGLDCWGVDGVPLTMARAVGLAGGLDGGRRALAVDWGYSNTTFCLIGDRRPLYSRRIHDCSFGKVLEAIMQKFAISLDEAQYLIDTEGLLPPEGSPSGDPQSQAAITDAASITIDALIRQLKRTLQFADTQRRHLQPAAVWLMGGGASTRNLSSYLAGAIELPIHVWTLPAAAPIACAADQRSAVFSGAAALSSLAWRAA